MACKPPGYKIIVTKGEMRWVPGKQFHILEGCGNSILPVWRAKDGCLHWEILLAWASKKGGDSDQFQCKVGTIKAKKAACENAQKAF